MLRVFVLYQHGLLVYHANIKLDTLCPYSQTEPLWRSDALAPMRIWRKVSFPKTQRCIAHYRNQTESRKRTVANMRFYFLVALIVFFHGQNNDMPSVGIQPQPYDYDVFS